MDNPEEGSLSQSRLPLVKRKRSRVRPKSQNSSQDPASSALNKILEHRQKEKERHRLLTMAMNAIQDYVPGRRIGERQCEIIDRAARYAFYLKSIMNIVKGGADKMELIEVYSAAWVEFAEVKMAFAQSDVEAADDA